MIDTHEFRCPQCGGDYFGSSSSGDITLYHCHGSAYLRPCGWSGQADLCFMVLHPESCAATIRHAQGEINRLLGEIEAKNSVIDGLRLELGHEIHRCAECGYTGTVNVNCPNCKAPPQQLTNLATDEED